MTKTNVIAEPGKQAIVITQVFDAPREYLYQAYTDPNLIPEWWGPKYMTITVDKMDVRKGGVWRFVQRDPHGNEFAFHGVYHENIPPERLVYTFEYEGTPSHVLLETVTFEELPDGQSRLTDITVFQTLEARDELILMGAEEGAVEAMDRFAELLAKVKQNIIT